MKLAHVLKSVGQPDCVQESLERSFGTDGSYRTALGALAQNDQNREEEC